MKKHNFDKDEEIVIGSVKSKLSHARKLFKKKQILKDEIIKIGTNLFLKELHEHGIKDTIKSKHGLNVLIKHKGTKEDSRIFCDKIDYLCYKKNKIFDHHLMFWSKDELVFKIWLPNEAKNKMFRNINEALKSCGIRVFRQLGD